MFAQRYRNISFATNGSLRDLLFKGAVIETRGSRVRELRNRVTVIERPEERCLFAPHRGNDIIATIAETLWVLAGRNDVAWLETYLPRAPQFSDDGETWRAAYGPRLRDWSGVDQISEVLKLIQGEQSTRRAAMSLFDPARDYANSKDIPCTNWLHWLGRDDRLHLVVGIRSNDVVWGFSGVNSFEWSVLQSYMALWSGLEVGDVTYMAPSFHLYEHHFDRAEKIVSSFRGINCYQFGLTSPRVTVPFADFDEALREWFSLEEQIRRDADAPVSAPDDPFLAAALGLVRIQHGIMQKWPGERIAGELNGMSESDLVAAGCELFCRKHPSVLEHLSQGKVSSFMKAYLGHETLEINRDAVVRAIVRLHTAKDRAYGISWKKRGEMTSILSNVARKVDRLIEFSRNSLELSDESALDTAVDLFVYALKYRLYLIEQIPTAQARELAALPTSDTVLSENADAVNFIAGRYTAKAVPQMPSGDAIKHIEATFEATHEKALMGSPESERLPLVKTLADLAFGLILTLEEERPGLIDTLLLS